MLENLTRALARTSSFSVRIKVVSCGHVLGVSPLKTCIYTKTKTTFAKTTTPIPSGIYTAFPGYRIYSNKRPTSD